MIGGSRLATAYPCVARNSIERGPATGNRFMFSFRSVRSYPRLIVYSYG